MFKRRCSLPQELHDKAKAIAEPRERLPAEVVRRGIEYMALAYPVKTVARPWTLPVLKSGDFRADFDEIDLRALAEGDELRGDLS